MSKTEPKENLETKFEKLTIKNNFMFGAVMKNKRICKRVLECVLGIKIRDIKYPELEKSIDKSYDAKSIRLDVYVEDDDNTVYNIEMQTTDQKNLPKRTRYYQGMIDLNIIDKGAVYNTLKKSFVIFICDYDEFGKGRYIYTFRKKCIEVPDLELGDETTVIVLNTKGIVVDVDDELRRLLDYIGGKAPSDDLTRQMDDEVQKVRNNEDWRREYMTLLMRDNENLERGKEIGEMKKTVYAIREVNDENIGFVSRLLNVSEPFIYDVKELIKNNPEATDDEIAEKLI